jgi:gamma-glutamylcyclotransferase (GGCT)/AIG2-like uncharacterized protein YtfP
MTDPGIRLFTYGSLRDPAVQQRLFGRLVPGTADALPGFRLSTVTISDEAAIATSGTALHLIVDETGDAADRIEGTVLQLTPAELDIADAYETADYRRVAVTLASGIHAFLYARA